MGGVGGLVANGLKQQGNAYVNDAYDKSGTSIMLDIERGVGAINLRVVN